ncbi:MAG: hypothetical protein AB7V27_06950 [Candidatus Binatia bacterium]
MRKLAFVIGGGALCLMATAGWVNAQTTAPSDTGRQGKMDEGRDPGVFHTESGRAGRIDSDHPAQPPEAYEGRPSGDLDASAGSPPTGEILRPKDVASSPDTYYGSTINVGAPVEEVYTPRTFSLDNHSGGVDRDVLVIAPRETVVSDGQPVVVRGKLVRFDPDQIKKEYSWFSMSPDLAERYNRGPLIIAESVRTLDGTELMPTTAGDAPAQPGR